MSFDERALALKLRAGDRQSFDAVYQCYAGRVMGFALRLTGSRTEAEDLVQEVFLAAYAARATFKGNSRLLSWLLGIAIRRWRDRCRHRTPETLALSNFDEAERSELRICRRLRELLIAQKTHGDVVTSRRSLRCGISISTASSPEELLRPAARDDVDGSDVLNPSVDVGASGSRGSLPTLRNSTLVTFRRSAPKRLRR